MTTITEFLSEQKRLAEAASPGPWEAIRDSNEWLADCPPTMEWLVSDAEEDAIIDWGNRDRGEDAEFIAAARSSVPRMIAALEAVMALPEKQSRQGDAPHVLSQIAGYNNALKEVRRAVETALLGGEGDGAQV